MKLLCATCSDPRILASCCRCERHLCAVHVPAGGELCRVCELEYIDRKSNLRLNIWAWLGFALVIPLIALLWSADTPDGLISLRPKFFLLAFGSFAGWYLAKTAVALRLLLFKRRFDQERRPRLRAVRRIHLEATRVEPPIRLTA